MNKLTNLIHELSWLSDVQSVLAEYAIQLPTLSWKSSVSKGLECPNRVLGTYSQKVLAKSWAKFLCTKIATYALSCSL